jgi:hypothetical protein
VGIKSNDKNKSITIFDIEKNITRTWMVVHARINVNKLKTNGIYIIEDINLDFIDKLYDEIISYNNDNIINVNIVKLIIPWPIKFVHPSPYILNMNNLIIIQKL